MPTLFRNVRSQGKAENICSHCGARVALGTSVGAIEAISDLEE
jgi:hypothetical protein